MKTDRSVRRRPAYAGAAVIAALAACAAFGEARSWKSLYWNSGAADASWDAATVCWTNESGVASAWVDDYDAVFDSDSGTVSVEGAMPVGRVAYSYTGGGASAKPTLAPAAGETGGSLKIDWNGGFFNASGMRVETPLADDAVGMAADTAEATFEGAHEYSLSSTLPKDSSDPKTGSWVTYWTGRKLSKITWLGKATIRYSTDYPSTCWFYTYDPATDTATAQFHTDNFRTGQILAANIALRQAGDDVEARVVGTTFYNKPDSEPTLVPDTRFASSGYNIATCSIKGLLAERGVRGVQVNYTVKTQNSTTQLKEGVSPVVIWRNTCLADLVAVDGRHESTMDDLADIAYGFQNDGETATVQMQRLCQQKTETKNGLVTCCYLEFRQVGEDVTMRVTKAAYKWFSSTDAGDVQFPYTRFDSIGGGSTYYCKPNMIKGYFRPVKIAGDISGVVGPFAATRGGVEFTGSRTFTFNSPLTLAEKCPLVLSEGAVASFAADTTSEVAEAQFSGNVGIRLASGASLDITSLSLGEGAHVVVDADLASKPLRIGTRLTLAERRQFSTAQGGVVSQDSEGYIVPAMGTHIIVK